MVVGSNSRVTDNSSGGKIISSGNNVMSSQVDSSPGTVRQTLRDIWANKFDEKSRPANSTTAEAEESTLVGQTTSKPRKEPTKAKCPVCKLEIEESLINDHLDGCLESPPPEASFIESSNPFADDEESGKCPICTKEVLGPIL